MREIVDQILAGNYIFEGGFLDFSCTKIEISISQGETFSGSFQILGQRGTVAEGRVLSTDYRMECLNGTFSGSVSEIGYLFHGEAVEEGETVKGAFRVISSQGEYSLPYVVVCEPRRINSSMGPIKNLFHFTNLAKSNWQEAVKVFYSKDFSKMLEESDAQYLTSYQGLSIYPGQEQNMEEFLIHVGKKQPVEFWVQEPEIQMEGHSSEGEYRLLPREITIVRNGWGYTALNVECDGDFLYSEKTLLTEDDFLGNYARLPIYVDGSHLCQGKNQGKVVLYNSFVSLEIPVCVQMGTSHLLSLSVLEKQRTVVALMKQYENFRTHRIGLANWLKETGVLVEKLIALDGDDPAPKLFKAQILITQERQNEAGWLLDHARTMMENQGKVSEELWAYYLYLTTLVNREEGLIESVSAEVERLYRQKPESWRIAWLLLYLSDEFTKMPVAKFQFIEKQFDRGSNSFVLYIEALQILNNNPSLLRKLDRFEQQVLYYGVRRDYLNAELVERFLELVDKNNRFSLTIYRILDKLYEKRADDRIVQKMCLLLTRGGVTGPKACVWYERGVEDQLRITNLYEFYMMSLNPENVKSLPKAVVLYFAYQNNLDYSRSALLYDYVLDNRLLFSDSYEKYLLKAEEFIKEQISRGRINRHLANLYARLITSEMITEQNAEKLARLFFATKIRVEDSRMRKVVVYAEGSTRGLEYTLTNGEACVPIYGSGYCLVFEDAYGNRFSERMPHELEKYMLPGRYVPELMKYVTDCPEFDLYLLREKSEGDVLDEGMAGRAMKLCAWEYIEPKLKKQLALKLMRQFYEMDRVQELDRLLDGMDADWLNFQERMEAMRYLVLEGNYKKAFEWVQKYGPYFPEAKTLARLVSTLLSEGRQDCDPVILAAASYLFHRSKHNAVILEYLGRWMDGTCKELRDVWKEMKGNGLDSREIEERILVQLMYTGSHVGEKAEIFQSFYQAAGDCKVTRAFLMASSYEYFVRERLTDGVIFRTILDYYKWEAPVPKACKLAFLKYYGDNQGEVTKEVNEALDSFLREMMAEKIHFAFYKKLKSQAHLLGELSDKVIVEYHAKPGGRARIHYMILQEDGEGGEYLSENMRDVFGGVCCKEFVLFFGETLQYYITEEDEEGSQLTESGNLQRSDSETDLQGSKYSLINDIVISNSLQDYDTLDSELENYYFKEYCGENLFVLH